MRNTTHAFVPFKTIFRFDKDICCFKWHTIDIRVIPIFHFVLHIDHFILIISYCINISSGSHIVLFSENERGD